MRTAWARAVMTVFNSLVNCALLELQEQNWKRRELLIFLSNNGIKCWIDVMLFTFLEVNSISTYMLLFPN